MSEFKVGDLVKRKANRAKFDCSDLKEVRVQSLRGNNGFRFLNEKGQSIYAFSPNCELVKEKTVTQRIEVGDVVKKNPEQFIMNYWIDSGKIEAVVQKINNNKVVVVHDNGSTSQLTFQNLILVRKGAKVESNIIEVAGKKYVERQVFDTDTHKYVVGLIPYVEKITPQNAPIGSEWTGPKGGHYVVIDNEQNAFEVKAQRVWKLPKSAKYVGSDAKLEIK